MLNKKDLQFIPVDPTKLNTMIVSKRKKEDVLDLVKSWFMIPELRPSTGTFEDYLLLTKEELLEKISQMYNSVGLYACQIGYLKLYHFLTTTSNRLWRTIRLSNDKKNINLYLNLKEIQTRMESYLENFFQCYVYAEKNESNDMFAFNISIVEKKKDKSELENIKFGYMIYFPETNLIVTANTVWSTSFDRYFKEALLHTFSADQLTAEIIKANSIHDIKALLFGKSDDNNNEKDPNPLDIRQKRKKGEFDDYVKVGEQKRRIVPIDLEDLKDRYKLIEETQNWGEIKPQRVVNVDFDLPLDIDEPLANHNCEDELIKMSITMEGLNVAAGIRECILYGKIENPAPLWLETIGISGAKQLRVTTEDVFIEEDLSESINRRDPMSEF
ncbi:hypothetical protein BD770DRAFT_471422 [Pilaira anomala]|nr:hypothetical protein BD770DRAFT_471422 [Pilaira anomala]